MNIDFEKYKALVQQLDDYTDIYTDLHPPILYDTVDAINELLDYVKSSELKIEQLNNQHIKIQYHNEELTVQEICERLEMAESALKKVRAGGLSAEKCGRHLCRSQLGMDEKVMTSSDIVQAAAFCAKMRESSLRNLKSAEMAKRAPEEIANIRKKVKCYQIALEAIQKAWLQGDGEGLDDGV